MVKAKSEYLIIAQISDLHLRMDGELYSGAANTHDALDVCLRSITSLTPKVDLLLVTGDLADYPDPRAYAHLRIALDAINIPYIITPGNHDDRAMVFEAFHDLGHYSDSSEFIQFTVETFPLRFVALDSLNAETGFATMCPKRLNWLADCLAEQPDRPTLVLMHHQPVFTRMAYASKYAFPGAKELERIISEYPNIVGLVCGHLHRPIHVAWAKTMVSIAPSVAMQHTLTLDNDMPKELNNEPIAYPVYLWEQDSGLICHLNFVGDFGPPYPLVDLPPREDLA